MAIGHFGSSKREERKSSFGNRGISHSSLHESKHKSNFHKSIHDHKKIHESMHLGKDRIISPLNHKVK
jgi:hypothetical protein